MSHLEPGLPLSVVSRLAELAVVGNADLSESLAKAARLAHEVLPDCLAASVTVSQHATEFTFQASADLARDLDQFQYDYGDGPCLTAMREDHVVSSPDLSTEVRWRPWIEAARAAGVCSMLSVPLTGTAGFPSVMNLYGGAVDGFTEGTPAAGIAKALAEHNGTLLANVTSQALVQQLAEQLQTAMESRARIEQAKGVLMAMLGVDDPAAWAYLVRLSQNQHTKIRDVAASIVQRAGEGRLASEPSRG